MSIPTRAVKAIIIKDDKILLLQRNPDTKGEENWDLPGGLVEDGESSKDTLIREVEEELGIEFLIREKSESWKFFRSKDSNWVYVQNYICEYEDGEIELSDEHISYEWIDPEDIVNYPVKDESLYLAIQNI